MLSVSLGYDGPVAVWIDKQPLFSDPNGKNPAIADEKQMPFVAEQGEHEILVALSSNRGLAWGIFMRFERHDLPQKLIAQGKYLLPDIVESAAEEMELATA